MLTLLLTWCVLFTILLHQPNISHSLEEKHQPVLLPNQCSEEKCGDFHIPFPFHLNSSCPSVVSTAFNLSCSNSSTLYLNIDAQSYKVLEFFSDGVLVDFPGTTSCRQYNDLNFFGFARNDYFGVSVDNVIGLYDCEDSSLCKTGCETNDLPGCDGNGGGGGSPACCYPLSDQSVWHVGDGFSGFSKYGCRGFSSWVVPRGTNTGKRGVKLEWAIPRNTSKVVCAANADTVNATAVEAGVRCLCQDGFVGDGFANGTGCLKSCIKDEKEAYGKDCFTKRKSKKVVIVAGVLAPAFIIVSLLALFCMIKRPVKEGTFDNDQGHFSSRISFRKACKTRLFTYHELEEATRGFKDGQKLLESTNGSIYAGVIGDGSHVAVHRVQCDSERDLIQVLSGVDVLSAILHRNLARLLGCCIDSGFAPLIVYEYPANGTLEEHLQKSSEHKTGLDWYKRLTVAAETASVLAFLQYEISPPIFHYGLKSGYIFLDEDYSVKLAGFGLLQDSSDLEVGSIHKNDVYDFGVLLLEMITGSKHMDLPAVTLQKTRSGKLEEIVDPSLYYHEQPIFRREQIEIVADLATRCLLFGRDGKMGMIDVAKELVHITKESSDGGSKRGPVLQETFSNSSLLQMISSSPDSIHVPLNCSS